MVVPISSAHHVEELGAQQQQQPADVPDSTTKAQAVVSIILTVFIVLATEVAALMLLPRFVGGFVKASVVAATTCTC